MMQLILLVATIIGAAGAAAYLCDRRRRLKTNAGEKVIEASNQPPPDYDVRQGRKEKLRKFEKRLDSIVEKYRKEGD